jgi:hypothetical protein
MHPNDQALGSVVRNFCIEMEGKEDFTEDSMYKILLSYSQNYKHKP